MNKDKVNLEWTVEDVDKAFLDAARGEAENKPTKPIALQALKAKAGLNKVRNGNQS